MNGPLLFIDTISENVNSSNQEFFDSRIKSKKAKAKYRVEDIEAMLYYRIHVLAEIYTKTATYEGVVLSVDKTGLRLQKENKIIEILLDDIENINILKL